MDVIATAANVSKQTLYNQFGSKEDLFKAMIADRAAVMRAPLSASALERHPRDMLADIARQYYQHACGEHEIGYYRMMIGASQQFPDIGRAYYEAGPKQMVEASIRVGIRFSPPSITCRSLPDRSRPAACLVCGRKWHPPRWNAVLGSAPISSCAPLGRTA
jgi:AcrR family transcriptional regulator